MVYEDGQRVRIARLNVQGPDVPAEVLALVGRGGTISDTHPLRHFKYAVEVDGDTGTRFFSDSELEPLIEAE